MPKSTKKARPALAGSSYKKAEASPGFLFWKAFNSWSRLLRLALDKLELTQVQYSIMAAVSYLSSVDEHVSQQDISKQLAMDKMMVSDVVKTLEGKGWLKRMPHPSDGRAITLRLTSDGGTHLGKAIPVVEAIDEDFFARLNNKEKKKFSAYLRRLA